jgi:hypothetical protein
VKVGYDIVGVDRHSLPPADNDGHGWQFGPMDWGAAGRLLFGLGCVILFITFVYEVLNIIEWLLPLSIPGWFEFSLGVVALALLFIGPALIFDGDNRRQTQAYTTIMAFGLVLGILETTGSIPVL